MVAADGSRLRVSTRRGAELDADHYALALYLPGAELTLHAALHPTDGSERQMLFEALDATEPDDLRVLDRGLVGNTMVATLVQTQRAFCMRVDACDWACVKAFGRSGEAQRIVTLAAPMAADVAIYELRREPTTVRLIRDVTPSGSVRILMTSLLDETGYPAADFGALCHRRWRIEEAFKRIKHRLRLQAVTGLAHLAFQQDFAAKVVADNLHALLTAGPIGQPSQPHLRDRRTPADARRLPVARERVPGRAYICRLPAVLLIVRGLSSEYCPKAQGKSVMRSGLTGSLLRPVRENPYKVRCLP